MLSARHWQATKSLLLLLQLYMLLGPANFYGNYIVLSVPVQSEGTTGKEHTSIIKYD